MSQLKTSLHENRSSERSGPVDWDQINWVDVVVKLGRRASFMASAAVDSYGWPIAAEDLLQETFLAIFSSPDHLKWTPEKGSIESFLHGVMKNKFRDLVKKKKGWGVSLDDPTVPELADSSTARAIELLGQLRADVCGDKKCEALIVAILQLNEAGKLNQQLSDLMDESPEQVANDRRRFRRRINRHG